MFDWLFNTEQFVPRRVCGNWSDELIWLHNLSDIAIFAAYMTIPMFLLYVMYKKNIQAQPVKRMIWLFALFIIGCGTTHLMGFIVFTCPAYYLDGVVKLITAIVSILTVVALIPALPKLLAMKTPEELEAEIERRRIAEQEILLQKQHLEATVEEQLSGVKEVNILLKKQMEDRQALVTDLAEQARDLTELQNATVQTCSILDSLMQLAPVGMTFFDCDGRYIRINNWLAKVNGLPPEAHIGKTVDEIAPFVAGIIKRRLKEALTTNVPILDDEVACTMPDDRKHIFLVSYYPVFTPDNKRLGIGVVVNEITGQKQLEAELRKSVIEITNSDRQKTEFLATLAHELRNPLSPILNSVYLLNNLLKEGDPNYEERHQAFQVIGRQVQHMSRLLDDLLEIARINRGKIKLRKEAVDLNKLLRRTVDLHKTAAQMRHHQTVLDLAPQTLVVNADPTRLEQIFGNIYSNAIKYTEDGGRIEIKTTACHDWVVVSVKDNGIGISPTTLRRMFEIFAQAEQSLDRSQGGLGIGLALSKDLVCLHGGTIEAKSDGLGRGSEFIVRLPHMHNSSSLDASDYKETTIPVANKQLRILIVDDNTDAAESLAVLLTHSGHDVQMVAEGATALKKVNVYDPDAILLDIGLPGLDGFTCCELLRESGYSGLVLAITGYASEADRERAKEAGFNYHLTKPVNPVDLAQILNKYADTKEA